LLDLVTKFVFSPRIWSFAGRVRIKDGFQAFTTSRAWRFRTRNTLASIFLTVLSLYCSSAGAAPYNGTGNIAVLRSHDAAVSWDWFSLTGVASLGTCPTINGVVLLVINDDDRGWRHFAIVLSAKRAGTTVTAFVDDTVLINGYCVIQYLQ
jgi:hypothetical protein